MKYSEWNVNELGDDQDAPENDKDIEDYAGKVQNILNHRSQVYRLPSSDNE